MPTTRSRSKDRRVLDDVDGNEKGVNGDDDQLDEDDDDDEDTPMKPRYKFDGVDYTNYQEYVEAKRKRNHEVLVQSGLIEAVSALSKRPTKRAFKPKVDHSSVPQRRSNRLKGVESDGHYVIDERYGAKVVVTATSTTPKETAASTTPKETFFQNRINDGSDLTIRQAIELNGDKWMDDDTVQKAERFVKDVLEPIPLFKRGRKEPTVVADWEKTLPAKIAAVSVNDERCVAKVTPQRIYSVAAHPSTDRIIVCAGDKAGTVGVWDVDAPRPGEGASPDVHMFRIFNQPVCFVHWTKDNGIVAASYDGSLRKLDVASGCFQEIFSTYDGDSTYAEDLGFGLEEGGGFWLQSVTPDHRTDPDLSFFLSTSAGTAIHVDLRVGHRKVSFQEPISEKKVNTLSLHPNGYSLASAGNDGTLRIWDVRKFGGSGKAAAQPPKVLCQFQVGKSINSAYFSPSGSTLVTTTMANTLDIFKDSHLASGTIKPFKRVRHDNLTGRWLSTFMAKWHPSLDVFVVGSMSHPRTMEIFDADGNLLRGVQGDALTAVVSRCCFHPSTEQLVLAGGNSSGRVTIVR